MKKLLVCLLLISLFISPAIAYEPGDIVYADGMVWVKVNTDEITDLTAFAKDTAAKFELEINTIYKDSIKFASKKKTTAELVKELLPVPYVISVDPSGMYFAGILDPSITRIIEHPEDSTVLTGETVEFNVRPHGTIPLTYQWQSSKDGGNTWNDIAGANTIYYSFTAQASDNGVQFRALVNGKYGRDTSNAAKLTLNNPLTVDPEPSDPVKPIDPVDPTNPEPTAPTKPTYPVNPTKPLSPGEQGDTAALNDSGGGCNAIMANGVMLLALSVLWRCGLRSKNRKKNG